VLYIVASVFDTAIFYWCARVRRNMYLSPNGARTWMEVTEPMLKSYVSWKVGRSMRAGAMDVAEGALIPSNCIKTAGFDDFVLSAASGSLHVGGSRAEEDVAPKKKQRCNDGGKAGSSGSDEPSYFHNPYHAAWMEG